MTESVDPKIAARVEERSYRLADEAIEMIAASGARTNKARRAAFEAWAIHKLATLEVLVELASRRVNRTLPALTQDSETDPDDRRN